MYIKCIGKYHVQERLKGVGFFCGVCNYGDILFIAILQKCCNKDISIVTNRD